MERYRDDPRGASQDGFEDQRLSQDSENTTKHSEPSSTSPKSSTSTSPEQRESYVRRKVTDMQDDLEQAGLHRPESLPDRLRQSGFNALTSLRWRRVVVGILIGLLIIVLLFATAVVFLSKKAPQVLPERLRIFTRDEYCTTWPVTKVGNEKYEFARDSGYRDLWTKDADPAPYKSSTLESGFRKPRDIRIVGIVFFGRREYVDVLDCYLERNLVRNGGLLDEIRFLARTTDESDLDWLDHLVAQTEGYSRDEVNESCRTQNGRYDCMWEDLTEENTMYIKIDDDVVWIDDDAIPNLVRMRIENKEAYAIGSNLVNSHLMAWSQWHTGAILPFLPERDHFNRSHEVSWRPSELPIYNGTIIAVDRPEHPLREVFADPPYDGHRWLPVNDSREILHTPMYGVEHEDLGIVVEQWSLGAQMHMSLLQNIEQGTLHRYWVGDGDGIWNPEWRRYNLNFAAIWSSDIVNSLPFDGDDEQFVTVTAPMRFGRPFLVADHSLVAHFHFGPQTNRMRQTDILDRYRAFANEFACPGGRKRMPLSAPCDGF